MTISLVRLHWASCCECHSIDLRRWGVLIYVEIWWIERLNNYPLGISIDTLHFWARSWFSSWGRLVCFGLLWTLCLLGTIVHIIYTAIHTAPIQHCERGSENSGRRLIYTNKSFQSIYGNIPSYTSISSHSGHQARLPSP